VLDRLLEGARAGDGGVLVVHGVPGVGKTALLEYAIEAGHEYRVARTSEVEGEMELPFAALQQLCSSFLELQERLPQPQCDALGVAFGLTAGPPPNPFLVGLAVLGLLSEATEDGPLLTVVDDAQWLDAGSARALLFFARRLLAEKIALVFATRELGSALTRLPELRVEPLGHRDARSLLESILPAPLDERVLDRIVDETESARAARVAPRVDADPARWGFRAARERAPLGEYRGELHATASGASVRSATFLARGGGRPGRRSGISQDVPPSASASLKGRRSPSNRRAC
jgi:AAA ATPase domain